LLDSAGRLIGVNTAIYSPSGAYAGIGFAIPVDTVNHIVPQLIRHGRLVGLGIKVWPEKVVRGLGIERGVLIYGVVAGGTADKAGIRPSRLNARGQVIVGDLLIALDEQPVNDLQDVYEFLDGHQVGDQVRITIVRGIDTRDQKTITLVTELLPSPE
jgi:S1-C subfamily serine protease